MFVSEDLSHWIHSDMMYVCSVSDISDNLTETGSWHCAIDRTNVSYMGKPLVSSSRNGKNKRAVFSYKTAQYEARGPS